VPVARTSRAVTQTEDARRPAWQALVALAGAATAIVIFVYLVGGAIVWERLHILRLPANQAVAPLPRDLLLVDGVRALAWPIALALAAAILVIVLTRVIGSGQVPVRTVFLVLLVVWLTALVLAILEALFKWTFSVTWQQVTFTASLGVIVVVGFAAVLLSKEADVRRVVVAAALAMAAVAVVVEAVDIRSPPVRMESARVLLAGGKVARGFYIGANSDTVYLAPNTGSHVCGRIVAVPQRRVARVDVYTSTKVWPEASRQPRPSCPLFR